MKNQLTIDTKVMKEYGVTAAVVLAIVNISDGDVAPTEIAKEVGITYPTAQKNLRMLADFNMIKANGNAFSKI
jgi:predicted transcriptional regulator